MVSKVQTQNHSSVNEFDIKNIAVLPLLNIKTAMS